MINLNFDETALVYKLLEKSANEYKDNPVHNELLLTFREKFNRNEQKKALLASPTLFKVRYIADAGFHDATTYGEVYRVIGTVGSQYVIINDHNATSHLQMTKFERVED